MPRRFALAVAAVLCLASSVAAQDLTAGPKIGHLLVQTLDPGFSRAYWLPNSRDSTMATEAIGIVYVPIVGAAGNESLEAGYYRRQGDGFALAGRISGLVGYDPRETRIYPDRIELVTTVPLPDEPRCCPSGTARWTVDRRTLQTTRLQ